MKYKLYVKELGEKFVNVYRKPLSPSPFQVFHLCLVDLILRMKKSLETRLQGYRISFLFADILGL